MKVDWLPKALDALADAYVRLDPPYRDALEAYVEWVNAALAHDPRGTGESRATADDRIWPAGWLTVSYRITPAAVEVYRVVVHTPRRKRN